MHGLTDSQAQVGAYVLILAETDGERRLPVVIGMAEAQSILMAFENVRSPRPMTHDLMMQMCNTLGAKIVEVNICNWEDGVFYAEIVIVDSSGKEIHIDARTSDAIAVALRSKCNIYVYERIMTSCSLDMDENEEDEDEDDDDDELEDELEDYDPEEMENEEERQYILSQYEVYELQECLRNAIKQERYESAKMYRDELLRRNALDDDGEDEDE
jgi:bifunctional DNase/RNase